MGTLHTSRNRPAHRATDFRQISSTPSAPDPADPSKPKSDAAPSAGGTPVPKVVAAAPGKKPVLVVPKVKAKEILIYVAIALALLAFLIFAIMQMQGEESTNLTRGTIKSHYSTGERETLLTVAKKGIKSRTADTGFYLKVEANGRSYDVMVSEADWNRYKDGDTIKFLKPEEEQKGVGSSH